MADGMWHVFLFTLMFGLVKGECKNPIVDDVVDLGGLIGEWVEVGLWEEQPNTYCFETVQLQDPNTWELKLHGHFYDEGLTKLTVFIVTFARNPNDTTSYVPKVVLDSKGTLPYEDIHFCKILLTDYLTYMVWYLCLDNGLGVVKILRRDGVPLTEETVEQLKEEVEAFNLDLAGPYHTYNNDQFCP